MRAGFLTVFALVALAGCNSQQLRFTTLRLSQSIPDLQERQVIDNLARIAASPANLPYYSVISVGTANIQDMGSLGISALTLQHKAFPLGTGDAAASRSVTGNWTLNPMSNPDRLRAMRAAYQSALGFDDIDPLDKTKLDAIVTDQKLPAVPSGWLGVGGKHDVPHEACVVSHYGHTYVWVMPEHSKTFADFALLMLNIATWTAPSGPSPKLQVTLDPISFGAARAAGPSPSGATPRVAPGEVPEPTLGPIEPLPESRPIAPRLYEDSPSINRGLFFVPR
jgi:hypothetical protein